MATAPLLIEGLDHWYGHGPLRRQVLRDVGLELAAGEIVLVSGPSGSGKSTLLTLAGALRSPQAGSLRVLGHELRGAGRGALTAVRRRIGFVFQQHNLLAALSALDNVALGARIGLGCSAAQARREAQDRLQAVGLGAQMHALPAQLSGGQRQRVAIARALAARPALVLADEPTASLDGGSGREVVELLRGLAREEGSTILLVTHDPRILDVADRLVHLEDGRLSTFADGALRDTGRLLGALGARDTARADAPPGTDDPARLRAELSVAARDTRRLLEALDLARDTFFQRRLEELLLGTTRQLCAVLEAERASLFLLEPDGQHLRLRIADAVQGQAPVRIPLGSGIAGAVALSGEPVRIDDAYADPRFNPAVDRQLGYRTRALLCAPVRDRGGRVIGVAQVLNPLGRAHFDRTDLAELQASLGQVPALLEGLHSAQALSTASTLHDIAAPTTLAGAEA
jgi:putative ABC transport system ATP-binding protein